MDLDFKISSSYLLFCFRNLINNERFSPSSSFPLLPVTPYSPYWVLSTDYTTFTVVYSCNDVFHLFHVDFAWILGRSRFLPRETVQNAKDLMTSEGIVLSKMKATDQTGCKDEWWDIEWKWSAVWICFKYIYYILILYLLLGTLEMKLINSH